MIRWLTCASPLLLTCTLACSSTVPVGEHTDDSGADVRSPTDANHADACSVLKASDYPNTCTDDSDCFSVISQYGTCDSCPAESEGCATAALPMASYTKYTAAIAAAFAVTPDPSDSSCPIRPCADAGSPMCTHGACSLGVPDAGASEGGSP